MPCFKDLIIKQLQNQNHHNENMIIDTYKQLNCHYTLIDNLNSKILHFIECNKKINEKLYLINNNFDTDWFFDIKEEIIKIIIDGNNINNQVVNNQIINNLVARDNINDNNNDNDNNNPHNDKMIIIILIIIIILQKNKN